MSDESTADVPPALAASADDQEWEPATLGERIRRRPLISFLAGLCWLGGLACLLVIALTPPRYQSSAMIKIEEQAPFIVFDSAPTDPAGRNYVETQIELMRSPMVLENLLANPEIVNAPGLRDSRDRLAALKAALSIDRVSNSDLFTVTYTSPSPKLSSTVANAVIVEYLKIQANVGLDRYQRIVDLLEDERRRRLIDVEELKKKVMALSAEVTGHDPFNLGLSLDVRRTESVLSDVYLRLVNLEAERSLLEAEIEAIESEGQPPEPNSESADGASGAEKPTEQTSWQDAVAELREQLEALSESDDALRGNPAYEGLFHGIGRVEQEFQKLEPQISAARDGAKQELATLKRKLQSLDREYKLLKERFDVMYGSTHQGNSKAVALTFAKSELAREEKVFEAIAQRKLAMQTESRAPARVSIQQKAVIPLMPVWQMSLWHGRIAIGAATLVLAALILTAMALQGILRTKA
jgi:polysaccharide biosynthesis transport protein